MFPANRTKTSSTFFAALLVALIFAAGYAGRVLLFDGLSPYSAFRSKREKPGLSLSKPPYDRVVSMAPSITETLFALGEGARVAGVTRFCRYPPQAKEKPAIGGFLDPNYEAVIALKPDLVILLGSQKRASQYLNDAGIETLVVNHETIEGVLASLEPIGIACGAAEAAQSLRRRLQARMEHLRAATGHLPPTRVMVCIDRPPAKDSLDSVTIAGRGVFCDDLIELAGGKNVYTGESVKFPVISTGGILKLDPEVIIDMSANSPAGNLTTEDLLEDWENVTKIKDIPVHIFREGYEVIPGPRFIRTAEKMARLFHPEVDWEQK